MNLELDTQKLMLLFGPQSPAFNALKAFLLLIIGYWLAKLISKTIGKLIHKSNIDERLKLSNMNIGEFVSKFIFYILMIFVLLICLEILGVNQVLEPLKQMLNQIVGFIPNIIVAFVLGYIGYFLATLVSEMVETVGDKIQSLAPKLHLPENINLVGILKKVVFIIIFVPILTTALDALKIEAITAPAKNMIAQMFSALPNIIYAAAVLLVAVILGRFISNFIREFLQSLNADDIKKKLQLEQVLGTTSIEVLVGNIVYFYIVFFAIIEALNRLGLSQISRTLNEMLQLSGKVFMGLLILVIGNFVANLVGKVVSNNENINGFTAVILKGVVIMIFAAIGLNSMGIATEIINIAFASIVIALGAAFALAFGLGGREAAGQELKRFFEKLKEK